MFNLRQNDKKNMLRLVFLFYKKKPFKLLTEKHDNTTEVVLSKNSLNNIFGNAISI